VCRHIGLESLKEIDNLASVVVDGKLMLSGS
jgi:hypothetical protein